MRNPWMPGAMDPGGSGPSAPMRCMDPGGSGPFANPCDAWIQEVWTLHPCDAWIREGLDPSQRCHGARAALRRIHLQGATGMDWTLHAARGGRSHRTSQWCRPTEPAIRTNSRSGTVPRLPRAPHRRCRTEGRKQVARGDTQIEVAICGRPCRGAIRRRIPWT